MPGEPPPTYPILQAVLNLLKAGDFVDGHVVLDEKSYYLTVGEDGWWTVTTVETNVRLTKTAYDKIKTCQATMDGRFYDEQRRFYRLGKLPANDGFEAVLAPAA